MHTTTDDVKPDMLQQAILEQAITMQIEDIAFNMALAHAEQEREMEAGMNVGDRWDMQD